MNTTIVLLVVLVVIIIICFFAKYFETNKLKENLTMTVTQSRTPSSNNVNVPEATASMPHLEDNSSCGQPLYTVSPSYNSSSCSNNSSSLPVQKTALNSTPGCVDSECHKSMVGLFGNLFKNLPSVDKLPHITHTLQITPKNAGSISTAATSAAANQHGNSIVPAQSSPASVPSSSSALKSITTAADCSAAGGKYFNYCPETGKYYCCGVDASKGYKVCGGTDGACPSNGSLKDCVCPSDNTYSPIGAFKDFVNGVRAMSKTISTNQNYSAEKCSTACNGYKYFGLQDPGSGGSQCFCSNSLQDTTQFGPYTPASNCTPNGAPGCNYVYEKNK